MGESMIEVMGHIDVWTETTKPGAYEESMILQKEEWDQRTAWSWDQDYLHYDTIHVGILSLYRI